MLGKLKKMISNLFTKKPKPYFARSEEYQNIKPNWLGLRKIYSSYDKSYNWCFIRLESHASEDDFILDSRNVLTIGWGPSYISWLLPFSLITPVLDYHYYAKDEDGKELEPKQIKWTLWRERTYRVMIEKDEGYFRLEWNDVDDMLYNITKHKGFNWYVWFFWKKCERTKWLLLNLDKTIFKDVTKLDWEDRKPFEEQQEKIFFTILDYDKEEIVTEVSLEKSIYSYGGKYSRWFMGIFKKPKIYTTLRLSFHKELGTQKGSWKGGTTGHSIDLLENETPFEAFKRYCSDHTVRGSRQNKFTNMVIIKYGIYKDNNPENQTIENIVREVTYTNNKFVLFDYLENVDNAEENYENELPLFVNYASDSDEFFNICQKHKEIYKLVNEKEFSSSFFKVFLKNAVINHNVIANGELKYFFTENAKRYILEKSDMRNYIKLEKCEE